MTTTDTNTDPRRVPVPALLARSSSAACTLPVTLMTVMIAIPGVMARCRRACRYDERGAISVEQFAWIGIALFLIVAAAAALKIYWGDVSTFVTTSWDSITGQGGS
jgi:hypothetical protein